MTGLIDVIQNLLTMYYPIILIWVTRISANYVQCSSRHGESVAIEAMPRLSQR